VPIDDQGEARTRYSHCFPFIVEDDADYRVLLARAFQQAGIPKDRMRLVADGEAAIEALQALSPEALLRELLPPSLIVLDIGLPGISGLEVLAWIRGRPALEKIPVFMLSESDEAAHVARAFDLRTDSYYVKPAGINELQTVVDGMLGFWHSRTFRRLPRMGPP
jgi:DNA-binding response OmpR family regulator